MTALRTSTRIYPIDIFNGMTWAKIDISSYRFAGIALDGTLWLAGRDDCGVFFSASDNLPRPVQKAGTWTEVAMGNMHGVVMDTDHAIWTWGDNGYSQLGLGEIRTGRASRDCTPFKAVAPGEPWKAISVCTTNTAAIRQDGSLWFWGTHNYDIVNPEFTVVPTRIGGDAIWIAVSTHEIHTLAVREDGSLWARGGNSHGQLGDGTTISRMDLTRIGKDTDWVAVKAGLYMSLAVKKNGTVWAWGDNQAGMVGDGTTTDRHSPNEVPLKAR